MVSSIRNAPAATLRRLAHLQRLLEPGSIQPVYQPIVRVSDLEAIGYEGLARFPYADGLSNMPPDVTLAAAGEIGLRDDLEVACWAAMATAGSPPSRRLLFVNISPGTLRHPGLLMLADRLPSRLVIEITEQTDITDYAELRDRLAPWVARGAQIAIDDTGAGYASLEHVVELRPDFLKLTRGLVADIDKDPNRQALLRALSAFAREVGAGIVAEGVERLEELEVLRESQIDFAQGWLFGRPGAPWPDVPPVEAHLARPSVSESTIRRLTDAEQVVCGALDAEAACDAVAEHLASLGAMSAVYLLRGERLRCEASCGYYGLLDGIPPEAGLVGRAFHTGTLVSDEDVGTTPDSLPSPPAVSAARTIPIRVGPRVIGVVSIESAVAIGPDVAAEAVAVAEALGRRLGEVAAFDTPTPGQRLARCVSRVAAAEDPDAVVREAAAAALEVSGLESVLIGLRDAAGELHAHHAAGPFADGFSSMSPAELGAMARWVRPGTAMVSMADAAGRGDAVSEALRQAGIGTLLVVPLTVGRAQLGFLALADRSTLGGGWDRVQRTELVELLGVQTAAQLRGLAAVAELRDRAARDPLTGLGHERTFQSRLPRHRADAVAAGRKLAVLLTELDAAASDEVLRGMAQLLCDLVPEPDSAYRLGRDGFALLVDASDRGAAQDLAWQLQAQARDKLGVTVSIGVAVADGEESDEQLLERADAAVVEVRRRGRDGVVLAPGL